MYEFLVLLFLFIGVFGLFSSGVIVVTMDEMGSVVAAILTALSVCLLVCAVSLSYDAGVKSVVEKKYCETCFSTYRNGESYCERDGSELISMEELIND